jgi:hypothetical protein
MSKAEVVNVVINALVAVGTIAVAVLAIWGDWFRTHFAAPKLRLTPHNGLRGTFVPLSDKRGSFFYHLKAVNDRPWVTVVNCRVLLKQLWRKGPDGRFLPIEMAVPLTFAWSPSEGTPPYITFRNEQVMDFGFVLKDSDKFVPKLISYTSEFAGVVKANESWRYGLEIVADNFVSPRLQVFAVAWDGNWSENREEMDRHMRIEEVTKFPEP